MVYKNKIHIKPLGIFVLLLFLVLVFDTNSQSSKPKIQKRVKAESEKYFIFPDSYSELDEVPAPIKIDDEKTSQILEKSRKKYMQALTFIQAKDTANACKSFEEALEYLNNLASYPGIEHNKKYNELAQDIMEDYEDFVKDLDKLDDNSQLFIIREKFFQQVETIKPKTFPSFKTLKLTEKNKAKEVAGKTYPGSPNPNEIKELAIPLVDNEYVQKSLTFLTDNPGRKFFAKWLERTGRWFPLMRKIAHEEEVPEELIFLSMIESGLNPNAVSRAQAVGLWQFIRSTGEVYGLNDSQSVWIDERRDPVKSTRAAMRHLRDLFSEFGDWYLALAAYNCGRSNVHRAMQKFEKDSITPIDFWTIRDKLPRETRNYVPLYIAASKIILKPEDYGFKLSEIKFDDSFKFDTVIVNEPVSLEALAKCIDSNATEDDIRKYNPELIRSFTPPDLKSYALRIPFGTKVTFMAKFASLTQEEKQPWMVHIVESGETITSIAKKYNISRSDLVDANNLKGFRVSLHPGTELKIPVKFSDYASEFAKSEDDNTSIDTAEKDTFQIIHTIRKGETLYSIANSYRVPLENLKDWNSIPADSNNIQIGRKLIVSSVMPPVKSTKQSDSVKFILHKVKAGESLNKLASAYNISKDTLISLNNLKSDTLTTGQVLTIKSDTIINEENVNPKLYQKIVSHKVKKGENLRTLARHYKVSIDDIKAWNPDISDSDKLHKGEIIKIYTKKAENDNTAFERKHKTEKIRHYKVRSGDTLSSIAKRLGVSISSIKKANKNIKGDFLKIGQVIKVH